MTGRGILAGLAMLAAFAASAPAQEPVRGFASDVRALMALQDAAARGDGASVGLQKAMLRQIADTYIAKPSAIAQTPRNSSAMLAYVLSGGYPDLVTRYIEAPGLPPETVSLLAGAALFMTGKPAEANTKFQNLEPRRFPPADQGRIAFVKAMLLPDTDDAKAALLEFTIQAMPGTLVEESASRRLALVAANAGQPAQFHRHMDRYLRRFVHSLYAPEFITAFAAQVVRQHGSGAALHPAQVDSLLNRLPQDRRRQIYLLIAASALNAGKPSLVEFAARRAGRLSVPGSIEELRANLYASAFEITSTRNSSAVERLAAMVPSRLPDTDRILLQAALKVAEEIRKPAPAPAPGAQLVFGDEQPRASVRRSEAALVEAEKTLQRGREP